MSFLSPDDAENTVKAKVWVLAEDAHLGTHFPECWDCDNTVIVGDREKVSVYGTKCRCPQTHP